jgi:polycomb protein EED
LEQNNTSIYGLAWAVRQELPFEPLLVFSADSLIYVFNVKTRETIGSLRGHGGVSNFLQVIATFSKTVI